MSLKPLLKRLIPERYRLLRYELYEKVRYYPELILSLGSGLECPFCGWRFRRFRPAGLDYPALSKNRVVGAGRRPNVLCPRCQSTARERLLYLYLKNKTHVLTGHAVLLHIAPEPQLRKVLQRAPALRYFSSDLAHPLAMMRADLTRLPHADGAFDVILCSHVLEHIPDDRQAMREIYRVLKPGGWAVLQVPIARALARTVEDPTVTSDEERIRLFGQRDHVRMYAPEDYPARLRSAGFSVKVYGYPRELGEPLIRRFSLEREEDLYICSKLEDPTG